MRIIWWTPGFPPDLGGIERLAALVVPELARRGAEMLVIANTDDRELSEAEYAGVRVVRLPSRRALAARDLPMIGASTRRVAEVKEQFRPDIVHVHLSDPSVQLHLTTATPGTRTIVTFHNSVESIAGLPAGDSLVGRAIATADAFTGVSEAVLPSSLRDEAARTGRLVAVIPNGIVLGDEPDAPDDSSLVLAVGRLVPAKGYDMLIPAFARSRARERGTRLRIVGKGPERDALERLAADCGVDVEFAGALPAAGVAEEFRRASLVVMPSRREGHPLVAIEAAAAGRAVLGSQIPGLTGVVVDGATGVLVPVDDPDALTRALDELLDDPDRLVRLGASARRHALDEFSLEACVQRHRALYDAVLDRARIDRARFEEGGAA